MTHEAHLLTGRERTLALRAIRPHPRPVTGHSVTCIAQGTGSRVFGTITTARRPPVPVSQWLPRSIPQRRRWLKRLARARMRDIQAGRRATPALRAIDDVRNDAYAEAAMAGRP